MAAVLSSRITRGSGPDSWMLAVKFVARILAVINRCERPRTLAVNRAHRPLSIFTSNRKNRPLRLSSPEVHRFTVLCRLVSTLRLCEEYFETRWILNLENSSPYTWNNELTHLIYQFSPIILAFRVCNRGFSKWFSKKETWRLLFHLPEETFSIEPSSFDGSAVFLPRLVQGSQFPGLL